MFNYPITYSLIGANRFQFKRQANPEHMEHFCIFVRQSGSLGNLREKAALSCTCHFLCYNKVL